MQRDSAALLDIANAAREILDFSAEIDRQRFLEDRVTQSAVMYQLLVIGEAAGRLSAGFRDQHPVAPWRQIVGLRNVLAHQYDAIDPDQLWVIVQRDVPRLLEALTPLLPAE